MKKFKSVKITILAVIIAMTFGFLKTYASTDQTGKVLGLEAYRTSGYAYQAFEKNIWKISTYSSMDSTVADKTKTIYCLKGGPGFGSTDIGQQVGVVKKTYNQYFDMKKVDQIESTYRKVLPTTTYNSLLWVLDHVYVAPGENPTTEKAQIAEIYKNQLLQNAGIEKVQSGGNTFYAITDDDIDVVQQIAVWYFTNTDVYQVKKGTSGEYVVSLWLDDGNGAKSLDDIGITGSARQEDAIKLLNYFINTGIANSSYAPGENKNPIELVKTGVTYERTTSGVFVGPFKLNKVANCDYQFSSTLKNANGQDIQYKLAELNGSSKVVNTNTVESYIGTNKEFYFFIADANFDGQVNFNISVDVNQTDIQFWSVTGAAASEQPVAIVNRGNVNYKDSASVVVNLESFDLALRKFIVAVNGTNVATSRVPTMTRATLEKLAGGTITTAEKVHPKTPIQVSVNDTVLYTIRVYNEGQLNGYATEITDYLPAGLQYIADSAINIANGWTNPSGDGRTIKTNKLSNTVINKFNGATLDYKDVQVECKVVASVSAQDQTLRNIAEITAHKDEIGNTTISGLDRDSTPNSLTTSQRNNYTASIQDDDDYEDLIIIGKYFDLALRKFIVAVNDQELLDDVNGYAREPSVSVANLKKGTATDAVYAHAKNEISVKPGDIVTYALKVYNEGQVDGYAQTITDHLPNYLEYISDADSEEGQFNASYGWVIDSSDTSMRTIRTNYLSKSVDSENLIEAFDFTNGIMDSSDYVLIKCLVKSEAEDGAVLTNIAEITDFADANGNAIVDRDSSKANLVLPVDENLPNYIGNTSNKMDLSDSTYFYKGQEDDDDFEKIKITKFDLALRKFITGVNSEEITSRIPVFTTEKDDNGNYIYQHPKTPILIETADIVKYTIRIFNEGSIAGYASEITDNIPDGLEFLPENAINVEYNWTMLDAEGKITDDVSKAEKIVTDYLSKNSSDDNLIEAFAGDMESPDYKDVEVAFKVVAPNTSKDVIINTAEISNDSDAAGNPINDEDSTPNNNVTTEDDIDIEKIKLQFFDLALRKFITAVDDEEVTSRIPEFTTALDENGNYIYEHPKTPVDVANGNLVTYTIRIFNEGSVDGYASEIKDDMPEGLEFLPDNETNQEYNWIMVDEDGNETTSIEEAKAIKTNYLSIENGEDNLIGAFNGETPLYKDVKVVFRVTEPNTSDRILINTAEITNDSDAEGNEVIDKDSTPDNNNKKEDDIDIEKVKVKFFDLALRKWVTQAIVIQNGKQTVTNTGHTGNENPEPAVKVELKKSQIKKVVVKFAYKIKVINEGEIAGYVKELTDYIPQGLKFDAADNPKWKEIEKNKITTDQLKDTLLQPGETATVDVILTWINGSDNMGEKINIAEISKDYNEFNSPDIDSTPNNKVPGEDDIDDAPVLLSVKTGIGQNYAGGFIIFTAVVAAGVILIKKYVL